MFQVKNNVENVTIFLDVANKLPVILLLQVLPSLRKEYK